MGLSSRAIVVNMWPQKWQTASRFSGTHVFVLTYEALLDIFLLFLFLGFVFGFLLSPAYSAAAPPTNL